MCIYILEDLCNRLCNYVRPFLKIPLLDFDQTLGMEETHPEMVLSQVACLGKYRICLSVRLSVCLYHHSGQTGRWISLKLDMMIGFDPT